MRLTRLGAHLHCAVIEIDWIRVSRGRRNGRLVRTGRYPGGTAVNRMNAPRIYGFVMGLFAFAILATGANAAVVVADLGSLNAGSTDGFSHVTVDGAQLSAPLPGGGEVIQFQINSSANISAAAASINLLDVFGISDFGFKLVQAGGGPGSDFSTFTELATGAPSGGALTLSYSGLTSGFYGFLFTGTITGTFGGFYAGNYTVSAVPLPPAVWLFLSALVGLVGVGRRKRKRAIATTNHPTETPLRA